MRRQAVARVHARDLGQQRRKVGRIGIALFEGLGHRAEVDRIAVAVEQVTVARKTLIEGVDRRQRRFVLDDEPQLLAADAVVFGRILLDQRLAFLLREVRLGELCGDVVQPLSPRDESLVELAQQLRLGGTLDRIVAHDAAHRADRHTVAPGDEQRNPLAVVDDIVQGRRRGHPFQLETVAAVTAEHGRVNERLLQRRGVFQIDILRIAADETARNLHFRRLAAAHQSSGRERHEKRLLIHLRSFSQLLIHKDSKKHNGSKPE